MSYDVEIMSAAGLSPHKINFVEELVENAERGDTQAMLDLCQLFIMFANNCREHGSDKGNRLCAGRIRFWAQKLADYGHPKGREILAVLNE